MSAPLRPVALVINPAATRAGRDQRAQVTRALSARGLEWSLTTTGPGDAERLARRAAAEGAALVVTLGGDGTAAEAAGALADGPVVMVPMPGGNANVFSRALGWPASTARALPVLEAALGRARVRKATLGRLQTDDREHVFAVNAGVGIDAATVEWIEARPTVKRRMRHAGFALGAATAALRARREPRVWVGADGAEAREAVAVLVACGSPYTYLGGRPLDLAPGAAFEGRLAWVALSRVHPGELAGILLRAARGRDLPVGGPALAGGTVTRELVISSAEPAAVQADGEPLGRHCRVRIEPGPALLVLDPGGAAGLKSVAPRPK